MQTVVGARGATALGGRHAVSAGRSHRRTTLGEHELRPYCRREVLRTSRPRAWARRNRVLPLPRKGLARLSLIRCDGAPLCWRTTSCVRELRSGKGDPRCLAGSTSTRSAARRARRRRAPRFRRRRRQGAETLATSVSSHAYICTRQGAIRLLAALHPLDAPFDSFCATAIGTRQDDRVLALPVLLFDDAEASMIEQTASMSELSPCCRSFGPGSQKGTSGSGIISDAGCMPAGIMAR